MSAPTIPGFGLKLSYNGVDFESIGTVSVLSQQSSYSPDSLPQIETRTVVVRIDARENNAGYNYDTLYDKIRTAREALGKQNKVLRWYSPGGDIQGPKQLDRPVTVVSHDLPEDPNGWGVYWQQINITFRYEMDRSTGSGAITARVISGTGTPTISLGHVLDWNDDWKNNFYSEWKNIRQRSPGTVTAAGELFAGVSELGGEADTRLATVSAQLESINNQLQNGTYITLTYGDLFDRTVRVDQFTAKLQDAVTGKIVWSATFSYTRFPTEENYAGAEFTSSLNEDLVSGMNTLTCSGKVIAASETLAVEKVTALLGLIEAHYGFTVANRTRNEMTKNWVNSNDTNAAGYEDDPNTFMELSFSYAYEKKAAKVVTFSLNVAGAEDVKSGLINLTYSGYVVAWGVDENAAYGTALAKARDLGGSKHPFRVNSTETISARKTANQTETTISIATPPATTISAGEFLRLEFSYSYQIKGAKVYLEMTSSISQEAFAESLERVSGFIVASTEQIASDLYSTLVRASYALRIIRSETLDTRREYGPNAAGTASAWFNTYDSTGFVRLDFSFSALKDKTDSVFNLKYATRVTHDYVALLTNTTVEGVCMAGQAELESAEAGGGKLNTFLTGLVATYGKMTSKSLDSDHERIETSNPSDVRVIVRFTASFQSKLSTDEQILKCQLSEDITYSGTRYVYQQVPDSYDRVQTCGTTQGSRTVTGSVTAVTEAAAKEWVRQQRVSTGGLFNTFRTGETPSGTAGAERYEEPMQLSTSFEFIPLPSDSDTGPFARGDGATFQATTINFTFREVIPNLPAPWAYVSP